MHREWLIPNQQEDTEGRKAALSAPCLSLAFPVPHLTPVVLSEGMIGP